MKVSDVTNLMTVEGIIDGVKCKFLIPFKCQRCGKCCKILMNNCKYLKQDKNGKYYCEIYDKRPSVCRAFPLQCDLGISKAEHIGCEGIKIFKKQWDWIRKRKGWIYLMSTSLDDETELVKK